MAGGASALTDKDLESALCGRGIAQRSRRFPSRQRVTELVERRPSAEKRFLERGQGFPDIHEHGFVIGG
jgi:hypothetical protein